MNGFPRTEIGGVSVSRMIIGTNWFLGYTHCTKGKSRAMTRLVTNPKSIADIIEVFFRRGVDTIYCPHTKTCLPEAIREAEQRTGVKAVVVSIPTFPTSKKTPVEGFDIAECEKVLNEEEAKGTAICMPHADTTDKMLDKCTREIRQMDRLCGLIRDRGIVPGLSTHTPETIVYADETGLDIETYCQPFNSMGFLMHMEVDWVARIIQEAGKPVIAIKPMAAGQLRPLQALTFCWNAIRERDMVCVGTMAPEEAEELIELSLDILSQRPRYTRSKPGSPSSTGTDTDLSR